MKRFEVLKRISALNVRILRGLSHRDMKLVQETCDTKLLYKIELHNYERNFKGLK